MKFGVTCDRYILYFLGVCGHTGIHASHEAMVRSQVTFVQVRV